MSMCNKGNFNVSEFLSFLLSMMYTRTCINVDESFSVIFFTGDFAEVAFQHVLSKRCIAKGSLTVAQINNYLDLIAKFNNEKKKGMVSSNFKSFAHKFSFLFF